MNRDKAGALKNLGRSQVRVSQEEERPRRFCRARLVEMAQH